MELSQVSGCRAFKTHACWDDQTAMASFSVYVSAWKPAVGGSMSELHKLFTENRRRQRFDTKTRNSHCRSKYDTCLSKRLLLLGVLLPAPILISSSPALVERPPFSELEGSGGLKIIDIREGSGRVPQPGDKVAIHYYARLAAKQGWRFDSTYDHKDDSGAPEPFVFVVGSGTVIEGLNKVVQSMKEGGVRRVIIPPSQGYQNTMQGPIPPNVFDRQRLYTTIFNPTRLANGEGSTLGTLIFDIELLRIQKN